MNEFLICFGLLGVMFVPIILLFLFEGCTWGSKIGGAIGCLLFWLAIAGMIYGEAKHDEKAYNNGVCIVCEGEYKFSGASEHRTSHHYYYTCEDCGHTIELNSLKK